MLRAALTQTVNAYPAMPEKVSELAFLKDKLADIRKANLEHHAKLIEKAASKGAKLVCLGELFAAPYFALTKEPMWLELAEDAKDGETATAMSRAARENQVVVVAPLYEVDPATGNRFNTAVVLDEKGRWLGRYRKTHIPCGANEQGEFLETFYYVRSEGKQNRRSADILGGNPYFPVFQTSVGNIGVAICYDRHFEGVVSALAKAGAELVLCPAVTFGEKSKRMWDLEFKVDAARHRVFIGGSNRKGKEKPWNQEYFGDSHFVGPDGERLKDLSDDPELALADLDLARLRLPDPSGWDLARDVRPGLY